MPVLDIAGVEIEPGDTVVYGVSNKYGLPLQMGEVVELIPYDKEQFVDNPQFDPSRERTDTWRTNGPNDNPMYIRGIVTHYKVKVKGPDKPYKDEFGDDQIQPGKKKTLDDPGRFAVIKKA